MKVLFVNPSQEHFVNAQQGWSFGLRDVGFYQPLGILYVATYLTKAMPDCQVKVVDAASPDMPYPELRQVMSGFAPDLIGISTYTHTIIDALMIARMAKELNPQTFVVLGGHHLNYYPRQTLTHDSVDAVIVGEGEVKFAGLAAALRDGSPVEDVPGVFTRVNIAALDSLSRTERFLDDIASLPHPDRSLVASHPYYNALTLDRKMTTIVSSRGCPFNCVFCPQGREPYRPRPAADVCDEIEACLAQGFTDFFFAEDTFNINNEKVLEFCSEIERRRLDVKWCCKARIHGLTRDVLMAMRRAGCYLINFGVETGTDAGLNQLHKGTTTAEIRQVFAWSREAGIQTMAYFMIGHPFEHDALDVLGNVRFLISLDPTYCNINSVNPVPFTPLFDQGVAKGILSYQPWLDLVLHEKMFTPANWEEHLSHAAIQRLRALSTLLFYFRPSYILRQLASIRSFSQFSYRAKVAINMLMGCLWRKA